MSCLRSESATTPAVRAGLLCMLEHVLARRGAVSTGLWPHGECLCTASAALACTSAAVRHCIRHSKSGRGPVPCLGQAPSNYPGRKASRGTRAAPLPPLQGGFQPEMTRTEAARILGLRESSAEERVKDAHRRLMIANHPDGGGSSFIAAKVNEAKDMLLGKSRRAGSAF